MSTPPKRPPARDRLLAAADELFYREGVDTVGIDRVIAEAGVAKASLYKAFGSKDELIRQYLVARHQAWADRVEGDVEARYDTPRDRLLGIFDVLGEQFAEPGFNGCAFINATVEIRPSTAIDTASRDFREWLQELFGRLVRQLGVDGSEHLVNRLILLYDGASIGAQMDRDPTAAAASRAAAATIIDAAIAARHP